MFVVICALTDATLFIGLVLIYITRTPFVLVRHGSTGDDRSAASCWDDYRSGWYRTFGEEYEAYCQRVRRWLPDLTH